jgi:hypothetical protein
MIFGPPKTYMSIPERPRLLVDTARDCVVSKACDRRQLCNNVCHMASCMR